MVNKVLTESHETKSIGPHVAAAAESKSSRGRFNHKKMGFREARMRMIRIGPRGKAMSCASPQRTKWGLDLKSC